MTEENAINELSPVEEDGAEELFDDEPAEEQETETEESGGYVPDRSYDGRILSLEIAVKNAASNEVISAALLQRGYDEEKFGEGLALVETAKDTQRARKSLHAKAVGMHRQFHFHFRALNENYWIYLLLFRKLFKSDDGIATLLELRGERKTRIAGKLEQISAFFLNAQDAGILDAVAAYNVGAAELALGHEKAEDAKRLYASYKEAEALAQNAKLKRDNALFELEQWVQIMVTCARTLLPEDLQMLEALFVMVPSVKILSKDRQKDVPPRFPRGPFSIPPIGIVNP